MTSQSPPKLEFDGDEYRHYLNDVEISDEKAEELLRALWEIMRTFVDLGWGLESIQMFLPDFLETASPDSDNPLKPKHHLKLVHNRAASRQEE